MMVTKTELIVEFVNTLHKHSSREDEDSLATPEELAGWLRRNGLFEAGELTQSDVVDLIDLRESLRTLLLANNAVEVDAGSAWAIIDDCARRGRIELRFPEGVPQLVVSAAGVDRAVGQIVAHVHAALVEGTWPRLKACRARGCEWAFYDNARNQSRSWCSMSSCGNREKARAFRRRHIASA